MRKQKKNRRKPSLLKGFLFITILMIGYRYYHHNFIFITKNSDRQELFFHHNQSNEEEKNEEIENNNQSNKDQIVNKLRIMQQQEERIKTIIEHDQDYPEELLDMLSRNIEMLDFVLDFPEKKGQVTAKTIGEVKKGSYPLLLQWDPRWGYGTYGDNYLAINGCAPTALSMVIAGLTGKNKITPTKIAKYAEEQGYYIKEVGTSWSLMTEGSKYFGVVGKPITLSQNAIYQSLKVGHPIICSMRKGDFTTKGHFIVLTGLLDGKIKVNDPNSKERSNQLWEYETLEYQIKNLWSFQEI